MHSYFLCICGLLRYFFFMITSTLEITLILQKRCYSILPRSLHFTWPANLNQLLANCLSKFDRCIAAQEVKPGSSNFPNYFFSPPFFQVFYFTHLLYIAFLTLLIFHAPEFWKWVIAPLVIFVLEKLYRTLASLLGYGKSYITQATVLASR